jgi:hypothetical protein
VLGVGDKSRLLTTTKVVDNDYAAWLYQVAC